MRLSVRLNLFLTAGVTTVTLGLSVYQVQNERRSLRRDLEDRAAPIVGALDSLAAPLMAVPSPDQLQALTGQFRRMEHVAGVAVYNASGRALAINSEMAPNLQYAPDSVMRALRKNRPGGEYLHFARSSLHIYARPIWSSGRVVGAAAVLQDTSYVDARQAAMWRHALAGVVIQTVLIVCVTLLILRWSLTRPMTRLVQWLRELHAGDISDGPDLPEEAAFQPLKREVTRLATTLTAARAAAEEEARLREAADSQWTPERLRIFIQNKLGDSRLFAVSNREPYEHLRRDGGIECSVPASGLVTALEPILRACDGTWIAQGTGDADHLTVDENDRLRVPPERPQYTLRRIWLTPEEDEGFYSGFANEGLWPLCHIAHTRPIFRSTDWEYYKSINRRFADALVEEAAASANPVVLLQDYHFALMPRMIKDARPDARTAIFWHIPWPNPEAFGICPWQKDLLDGLLGADLIGFHVQAHCNNFLDTVDRALEARVDRGQFTVERRSHITHVQPFPISVGFTGAPPPGPSIPERSEFLASARIDARLFGIGVDRVDYTKGIPERFLAIERFLEKYPTYQRLFTFVQIGAPSRTHIHRYDELFRHVAVEAERINRRFQDGNWKPILFLPKHHSHERILPYYRHADLCLVTSLHDGMNLVAKEYVAARGDDNGVLVLSRFTGASHELADALIVNPYDTEELADAIYHALEMPAEERQARMARMRAHVREHNVYRWAGTLISALAAVRLDARESGEQRTQGEDEPRVFVARS